MCKHEVTTRYCVALGQYDLNYGILGIYRVSV
jgi:hypothetical protein